MTPEEQATLETFRAMSDALEMVEDALAIARQGLNANPSKQERRQLDEDILDLALKRTRLTSAMIALGRGQGTIQSTHRRADRGDQGTGRAGGSAHATERRCIWGRRGHGQRARSSREVGPRVSGGALEQAGALGGLRDASAGGDVRAQVLGGGGLHLLGWRAPSRTSGRRPGTWGRRSASHRRRRPRSRRSHDARRSTAARCPWWRRRPGPPWPNGRRTHRGSPGTRPARRARRQGQGR